MNNIPKLVIFGINGQIGHELFNYFKQSGFEIHAPSSLEINFAIPDQASNYLLTIKPAMIINAAGYTHVDRAEIEVENAYRINAHAVQEIATASQRVNALLVHYSSDYIFSGNIKSPYCEYDEAGPLNVYGKSKFLGEEFITHSLQKYIILRTSWVYGLRRMNFVKNVIEKAKKEKVIYAPTDQIGSPTWCNDIARLTFDLCNYYFSYDVKDELHGIYHLCSVGEISRFEWARRIVDQYFAPPKPEVIPILTQHSSTLANRPAYSVLDTTKIQNRFKITMPDWESSLIKSIALLKNK